MNYHDRVRIEFEKMMAKLHPQMDMLRFKSGAYRSHETYRMFMSFNSGYAVAVQHILGVRDGM